MQTVLEIKKQVQEAVEEVCEKSNLSSHTLFVLGCSSSEIRGEQIGKGGSLEIGKAVVEGALAALSERGIYLAVQCCEHLNRALVMEREGALRLGYEEVSVHPVWNAGGSTAASAMNVMKDPVVVLEVRADAGLDIGTTMIGMHLKRVAVPLRLEHRQIGCATANGAKTRPMLIGGERAQYK